MEYDCALQQSTAERKAIDPGFFEDDPAPPVAREGWPIVAAFLLVTGLVTAGLVWWLGPFGYSALAIGLILSLWCIWFFRDPARRTPRDPDAVVAPADGRIVLVGPAVPPKELGFTPQQVAGMQRVCIFMNVFNVHVNRSPVGGKVVAASYHPGAFFNAALDKASEQNERYSLAIQGGNGSLIAVVQIAGLVARRIVCKTTVGRELRCGERYGLIRFGSRVDVYLPAGATLAVAVGQRTVAGQSIIARLGTPA
jgi:phosphatidylserine decarboxylase